MCHDDWLKRRIVSAGPEGPPAGIQPVKLQCAPVYGKFVGCFVSDTAPGFPVHFHDQRTYPHTHPAATCAGCRNGQRPRWKGYACAVSWPGKTLCVCEISQGAAQHCPELRQAWGKLRGLIFELWRTRHSKRAPVRMKILAQAYTGALPPSIDLVQYLLRLWGLSPRTQVIADPRPIESVEFDFDAGRK